ncbi:hypothetical protein MASR2M15_05240 [Anaerolineales bacterium]
MRFRPLLRDSLFLLLLMILITNVAVQAQIEDLVSMTADPAYDTFYRENFWFPIKVQVRNQGDAITGKLIVRPDVSGRAVDNRFSTPIDLPSGSEKTVTLYILANNYPSQVLVELLDAGGAKVADAPIVLNSVNPKDRLYVTLVGPNARALSLTGVTLGGYAAQQAIWSPANLPDYAQALQAIDVLVISNADMSQVSNSQLDVLTDWVTGGGYLLVTGGTNWRGTEAINHLLPMTPTGTQSITEINGLSRYTYEPTDSLSGDIMATTGTVDANAQVMATSDDVPLWVRWRVGLGTVDFLTIDPTLEPLNSWSNLNDFWFTMFSSRDPIPGWTQNVLDYEQAATAISILPGVDLLPSVLSLCGFLFAYIFVIGPLNYLVLSRINRREWAWVTIPIFILLFSFLAWSVGFNLRGNEVTVSRLTVVESWENSDIARFQQFLGVLAPRRSLYGLEYNHDVSLRLLPQLSDVGVLGGNITQAGAEIIQSNSFHSENVAVDGGYFANFQSIGQTEKPTINGTMVISLNADGQQILQGSIRNDSPITLHNAVLMARGLTYYFSAPIPPNEFITFSGNDLILTDDREVPPSPFEYSHVNGAGAGGLLSYWDKNINLRTAERVLGDELLSINSFEYNLEDQIRLRRQAFLSAFMRDQYGASALGDAVYLIGWDNEWPRDVDVIDAPWNSVDDTIYIIEIDTEFEPAKSNEYVRILPNQFSWVVRERELIDDGGANDVMVIPGGHITFRFTPLAAARLDRVELLQVELDRSSGYGGLIELELYNWQTREWDLMQGTTQEIYSLESPAAYIGANNAVEIRLSIDDDYSAVRVRELLIEQRGYYDDGDA